MEIEVSARHNSVTNEMKEYARSKVERLLNHYDRILRIQVVLSVEGDGQCAETIAEVERSHDLVSQACSDDMNAAIDAAVDKLDRQISRLKDRKRDHKGRGPNPHQPSVI